MRCVLGFDGGGSKTECVLMDVNRNVLARGRGGGSNPGRAGLALAISAINQAAEAAMFEARVKRQEIMAVCAGLSGAGNEQAARKVRGALAGIFPGVPIKICTDLQIALAAAGEGPVIVLVAGTGSAAIGRGPTGEVRRAGGLGPQLGDEGSGTDIGRKAVLAAKSGREKTGEETALGKQLLRQSGVANWSDFRERVPGRDGEEEIYPRLFPVVANAADAGDDSARAILRAAAVDLTTLVESLARQLNFKDAPFRLAKTGGMMGRCAFFDAEIEAHLRQAARTAEITSLAMSPAHAAALLALEFASGTSRGGANG
jgi:N-acetylglucosamine kinase-like BadF-type ATPase